LGYSTFPNNYSSYPGEVTGYVGLTTSVAAGDDNSYLLTSSGQLYAFGSINVSLNLLLSIFLCIYVELFVFSESLECFLGSHHTYQQSVIRDPCPFSAEGDLESIDLLSL